MSKLYFLDLDKHSVSLKINFYLKLSLFQVSLCFKLNNRRLKFSIQSFLFSKN